MRDRLPGESDQYVGTRNGTQYLSRIVRGQFVSPDAANGKVQVQTHEVISTRDVTVPVLWFSGRGVHSSWGRFMPAGGENVHVAYRNDGTSVIVGYDANAPDESGRQEGWPFLNSLHKNKKAGYSSFKPLKPGEFDFKSGGDAYIHGTANGTLYLSGGQSFIRMRKQSYTIDSKASAYRYNSETTLNRLGTVFRENTEGVDEPVGTGALKEFLIDVNVPIQGSGAPSSQSVAKLHMGNIVDKNGAIESSSFGGDVRYRLSLGDSLNKDEVFSMIVDNNGDVEIKQLKPSTNDDNTLSWQVGDTTFTIAGVDGTFFVKQKGVAQVSTAIAEHLESLWNKLKQAMDLFDKHIHGSGVGPTGTPTPPSNIPAWDPNINANKHKFPDN